MTDDLPRGFSDLVGLEFTEVEPGYSRGELEVTDELIRSCVILCKPTKQKTGSVVRQVDSPRDC